MAKRSPRALSAAAKRVRHDRILRIAQQLGFVGTVEYRHVFSQSGGAQYGQGRSPTEDVLMVYAEAFDRDADPDDFSLEAMLAHERGHQILARHPRVSKLVAGRVSLASEEILASVIGALLCPAEADRQNLLSKAAVELIVRGVDVQVAAQQIQKLHDQLESLL